MFRANVPAFAILAAVAMLPAAPVSAQDPCPLASVETVSHGAAGTAGVPRLAVLGLPAVDGPVPGLRLVHGAPGAQAQVVAWFDEGEASLPQPSAVLPPGSSFARWAVRLDADGNAAPLALGPAKVPASLCGTGVYARGLVADGGAPGGLALSPVVRLGFGAGSAGAGLFGRPWYLVVPGGEQPAMPALGVGDQDGNGRLDLIVPVGTAMSSQLRTFRQLAEGTLAPPVVTHTPDVGATEMSVFLDRNGDGRVDVTGVSAIPGGPPVLFARAGLADGHFGPAVVTPTPATLHEFAVGDVTGDGLPDVVTASLAPGVLSVLPGGPDLELGAPIGSLLTLAGTPARTRLADLDGDGSAEAIVVTQGTEASVLAVLPGTGTGAFGAAVTGPVGLSTVQDVELGDLDGDGMLDLVVAGFSLPDGWRLDVRRNDGQGGLLPAVSIPLPLPFVSVRDLALADLDEDGTSEICAATDSNSYAWSLQPDGTPGRASFLGDAALQLAFADLDADGHSDLVMLRGDPFLSRVGFLPGTGGGDFGVLPTIPGFDAWPAHFADLDGDGRLDIAGRIGAESLEVVRGRPRGRFGPPVVVDAGGTVADFALGDLDLDGVADAVVVHKSGPGVALLRGVGDGSFAPPETVALAAGRNVGLLDADEDGRLDVVVTVGGGTLLDVLPTAADGSLGTPVPTLGGPASPVRRFSCGDLDGDGHVDVVAQASGGLVIARGTGTATFGPPQVLPSSEPSQATDPVAVGDVDGDGDLDIVSHGFLEPLIVRLNDGAGQFVKGPFAYAWITQDIALADVNLDGALDIVDGGVWLGTGAGLAAFQPGDVTGTCGDLDGDGDPDLFSHGRLFLNRVQ